MAHDSGAQRVADYVDRRSKPIPEQKEIYIDIVNKYDTFSTQKKKTNEVE
jgi:hypothetical protein